MSLERRVCLLALAVAVAGPTSAWAFTGVGGCSGLPEYYRALGALQGGMESACAMSAAQARHILSAYGGVPGEEMAPSRPPGPRRRLPAQQP